MCSCHYPRMLCHVFWSQVEYKIVCFISLFDDIDLYPQTIILGAWDINTPDFLLINQIILSFKR